MKFLVPLIALLALVPAVVFAQDNEEIESDIRAVVFVGQSISESGFTPQYGAFEPNTFEIHGVLVTITEYSFNGSRILIRTGAPLPPTHYLTSTAIGGQVRAACVSTAVGAPSNEFICPTRALTWTAGNTYNTVMTWESATLFTPTASDPSIVVAPPDGEELPIPVGSTQPAPVIVDRRVISQGQTADLYFNWINTATIRSENNNLLADIEYEIESRGTGRQMGRVEAAPNQHILEGISNLGGEYPLTLRIRYIWDNTTNAEVTFGESAEGAGDELVLQPDAAVASLWSEEVLEQFGGHQPIGAVQLAEAPDKPASFKGDVASLAVVAGVDSSRADRTGTILVELGLAALSITLALVIAIACGRAIRTLGAAGVYAAGAAGTFVGSAVWIGFGFHMDINAGMLILVPGLIFCGAAASALYATMRG